MRQPKNKFINHKRYRGVFAAILCLAGSLPAQDAPVTSAVGDTFTLLGSMAHVASAGYWSTGFTLVNTGASPAQARLRMFGDGGAPFTPSFTTIGLGLPLNYGDVLTAPIAPNAMHVIETTGSTTIPVAVGSAQLTSNGPLSGFAVFRFNFNTQEAVVPLETRQAASYYLPFDNTGNIDLGVALASVGGGASVPLLIRDDAGQVIGSSSVNIPANGHTSFVLRQQYAATANKRGTVEFQTPSGGQISVLGVRYTPPGTLTTIPVLANVDASGGTMAHVASGGGWKTSVVLVNTGTNAAGATVRYFDDAGSPLNLPLTFPQGAPAVTASQVDRTLAAKASLVIDSEAPAATAVKTGSIQLTTNGNVGGFVIFRFQNNGQEAVVPLESRAAGSFVIAFDNSAGPLSGAPTTTGLATGVAVSNAAVQAAAVQVILRDSDGTQIGTNTLNLAANAHQSFVLADQYPVTAGKRGTIEFVAPAGGKISALGIRTITPQLTFTTLPPFAR